MEKLTPREEELMRLFLDAGPVVRARTGCALARTETSFQYVIDDGAWPRGERYVGHKSLWRHLPVLSARQRGGVQPQDAEGRGEQVFRQFLPRGGFVARTGGENLRGRSARLIRQIESQTEKR